MPNTSTKRKDITPEANGNNLARIDNVQEAKEKEKSEREDIVLWRKPVITLEYFVRESVILLYTYGKKSLEYRKTVAFVTFVIAVLVTLTNIAGPHQSYVQSSYKQLAWCLYWCGLGVLSSVGLGTGLHTFLLYLGPHIAKVTIAAYECGSVNFPEPPYPDDIICPEASVQTAISIFTIMSKVRLEAMCWGAGTALGELPPYFMARAARLSGYDPDDEGDLKELEELERKLRNKEDLTLLERAKVGVEKMVERVGFLGILACASIPNPLFDLAGITCGHFLVPFWTFFGATLIGKAIIKMHIQKLFVIIAFNETLIEKAIVWLTMVPIVGPKLQEPFKEFLVNQKNKLHRTTGSGMPAESGSILAWIFEKFVIAMILYFVISIVNSLAQSYHKRIHKTKKNQSKKAVD